MKCIEDEIPFELPQGWEWTRIQNIAFFHGGYAYKSNKYINKSNNLIVRIGNVKNDILLTNIAPVFIDEEYANDTINYKITENDILFTMTGTKGKRDYFYSCVIKPKHIERYSLFLNQRVGCLRLFYTELINSDLLSSFLKSTFVLDSIFSTETGNVNQGNIGSNSTLNLLIPIPPISEQYKISSAINSSIQFIEKIETNKTSLQDLIKQTKSKILDLAIRGKLVPQDPNDEPASVLLERIKAEKEELIRQGKIKRDKKESVIFKGEDNSYYETIGNTTTNIDEEIPFELPEGWEWCRLGNYTEKVTDQVASGSFTALRENVPSLKEPDYAIMVKTADFANDFSSGLTYTTKHGYDFLENSNLFGGELIMSNIGSIGKIFIVPFLNHKMTLAPNSIMIRFVKEEHRDYMYHFLKSPLGYRELISITSGTAMLKFNKTDLKTIFIPVPPLPEQTRIVKAIETAFAQLDEIANSIA